MDFTNIFFDIVFYGLILSAIYYLFFDGTPKS